MDANTERPFRRWKLFAFVAVIASTGLVLVAFMISAPIPEFARSARNWVGFIALLAVIWVLIWLVDPIERRRRRYKTELAAREPLPDEALMRQFVQVDADPAIAIQIRHIFAKYTEYPVEKMRLDDDLTFFWDSLDMVGLIIEIEEQFHITITDEDAQRTPCTISAVSLLVARLCQKGAVH